MLMGRLHLARLRASAADLQAAADRYDDERRAAVSPILRCR